MTTVTDIPRVQEKARPLGDQVRNAMRVSYALRHVPESSFRYVLPRPDPPSVGDIVLARVETIGKTVALDTSTGRRCALHKGELVAVVFGNRYATLQFEGYARSQGDRCHLLSMGGLCGLVASRHEAVPEPSALRLEGALGDARGLPLRLRDFVVPEASATGSTRPRIAVVLGTSMDAGKTYTARTMIRGLRRQGVRVAGIKLTGTAAGRDTYAMQDAGACIALDFVDGGLPSTYLCSLEDLLTLYRRLVAHAAAHGASWVVIEIADGIIQGETAALLASTRFTTTVDGWVLAANDALGAAGAVALLRERGITPLAVSGIVSRSTLGRREVEMATRIRCLPASDIEEGGLNGMLTAAESLPRRTARSGEHPQVARG
jgi:hypothetical protein